MKQKLALKKFMKEGGDDWRKSKYVYAISSIQAHIFQIQTVVKKLLAANDSLLKVGATMNSTEGLLTSMAQIDIYSQPNIITLRDNDDMPSEFVDDFRFVKQRSPKWFGNRENFRLTGSTIFNGIGLDTLKKQQKHFDKVVRGVKVNEELPDDVKKRMEHGTVSEIHAVATLATKVLPLYYPGMSYVEEGAHIINGEEKPLMLVSPDGSLCDMSSNANIMTPLHACEFKCPSPSDYTTPVHYAIPVRYIPQILAEMVSMDARSLLYLCWTEESSTVFRAHFDDELWILIQREAETVYGTERAKRPTRFSETSKVILKRLVEYQVKYTDFICEVPSVKGTNQSISFTNNTSPYVYPVMTVQESQSKETPFDVNEVLNNVTSCVKDTYLVCRKKATEVLVWILADTDRMFNQEIPYSIPVAYALKGYSLGMKGMRAMNEAVLQSCYEHGIDVSCCCTDGQWVQLATRDKQDKPLTMLQLQRDVHAEATKMSRDAIVKELETRLIVNDIVNDIRVQRNGTKITISCPVLRRLTRSMKKKSKPKKDGQKEISPNTDNLSCLPDEALETLMSTENQQEFEVSTEPSQTESHQPRISIEENAEQGQDSMTFENVAPEILKTFKGHKKETICKRWKDQTSTDLQYVVNDINTLRNLTHDEMNVIINLTSEIQKQTCTVITKYLKLIEKANAISKLIGQGEEIIQVKTVKHMQSLKSFAAKKLKSCTKYVPKEVLNNVMAAKLYNRRYTEWQMKNPFEQKAEIGSAGTTDWFSYPEFDENRQKLEPKCLDAHHLLVNLRVKVCKDGVAGIRKQALHKVAERNSDIISKGLVFDLLDKQNNAFAKRTFSQEVEEEMRDLKFEKEADFCRLIREWYEAEDSPGMSANERIMRRLALKKYLMTDVDFGCFPPPGMYVKGFPKVMYEGFLQRIDTTIQLYGIIKAKTYNQRAISSLVNETFFGEMSEMEPTRLGCPKAVNIPRLMATVTELQHIRHDPSERTFQITTTKKPVYPQTKLLPPDELSSDDNERTATGGKIEKIDIRNHAFDAPERRHREGKRQRKSKHSDISKSHEVTRGCLPVRFHHKIDEGKVLATTRDGK